MAAANTRKWTLMIYMAGDNNLSEECVYALTEIKEGLVATNKLDVLAQFDPSGVKTQTRRYRLRPAVDEHGRPTSLEDDATDWTAYETNTGEPSHLLDFLRWGISEYKANNYMVVLTGHGSGTDDDFLLRDENPPDALSISELHEVFKNITDDGHKIAILGMDTCLMNMAEVCYELNRTEVQFIVGSEGFSPNTGWPFKTILEALIGELNTAGDEDTLATPEWLAGTIVSQYADFYKPYVTGGISVDQSALRREKGPLLTQKVTELSEALLAEIEAGDLGYKGLSEVPEKDMELPRTRPKQDALILAHWEAQSFNGEVFVDLYDFCRLLKSRYRGIPNTERVRQACQGVMDAIKDLVLRSCYSGAAFQYAYGISIYFPWAVVSPKYENLTFPKETKWFDFLTKYVMVTRRPPNHIRTKDGDVGRASVPTNKGRDGKVESMRNPPFESMPYCNDLDLHGTGSAPGARKTARKRSSAERNKTTRAGKKK